MAGPPRSAEVGCLVCDAWADEMISLPEHPATVCRERAAKIGRHVLGNLPAIVARFWPRIDVPAPPPTAINVADTFAAFEEGVERSVGADDAQAHLDLAVAYGGMGLMTDAVREASVALGAAAPLVIASRALNWLFAPGRAHPDALHFVVADLRRVRARLH